MLRPSPRGRDGGLMNPDSEEPADSIAPPQASASPPQVLQSTATDDAPAAMGPKPEDETKGKEQEEKRGTVSQLLFGAGGIYACFLYYGSLQEDVFRWRADDGAKFSYVWLLSVLESVANVIVGFIGLMITGRTLGLPQDMFGMTGTTQVFAKYCTNAALASGLSFPVATLAKSGKMVPVMIGSLFIGGASYTLRDYLQVAAIVLGTVVVSMSGGKSKGKESTLIGVAFICGSLLCDGLTGGVQKRLKKKCASKGVHPKPYDFMFWTNLYMTLVAFVLAVLFGEILPGTTFLMAHTEIWWLVTKFCVLSALGQSFIFYTIATFDPLVCSTVTTTRKVFSVLYSLIFKGHSLKPLGWVGVMIASAGVLADLQGKSNAPPPPPPAAVEEEQKDEAKA